MTIENLPEQARSVIISMNPGSGASHPGSVVDQLHRELDTLGYHTIVLTDFEQVKQSVKDLRGQGQLRAVVAAGGDGTVSLLANGLPAGTPLAILPLGTENLLAKFLGIKTVPSEIASLIDVGATIQMDTGKANGKLFLVMASCGFDADVVKRLHSKRKGNIRHWSYARPIFKAIGEYRYPEIRIFLDDEPKPLFGKWAFVFNVPRYAMNLPIVEDADCLDGHLDLCLFRGGNLISGLYYLFAVITRQHKRKATRFRRFQRMRIESDELVPFQLDGDPGGELPLEIEVQPLSLRVVVSQAWIAKNRG